MNATWEIIYRAILAAIVALALALSLASVVSCVTAPAVEPPRTPAITDHESRRLAHDAEMDRAAEDHRRAQDAEQVAQVHLMGRITVGIGVLGAFCLVAGFFLIKSSAGQSLAFVGVLCITFAYAGTYHGQRMAVFMAIGFGIVSAGALVFLGVTLWRYMRTSKALEQTVAVNEAGKAQLPEPERKAIWGSDGIAAATYTPSTKRVVESIRAKLSKQKGNHATHPR